MTKEENVRYSRQIRLPEIGVGGQLKIREAKILVVGAGGLGCPVAQYLCGAGVGSVGIIDFDKVETHNLHRQVLYSPEDVGHSKAEIAGNKLAQQYPDTRITIFNQRLNKSTIDSVFLPFDLVVDASDNFSTRYLINDACVKMNKPLIYGSILGFEGQIAVFNLNGSKNLRDLFPQPPDPKDIPGCDENGVLATLPGIIGTMMAHETLKVVLGLSSLADQLLILDTEKMTFIKLLI